MTGMQKHRLRTAAAVVAAAALVPSLSGCWAGFDAQTSMQANQAVGNGADMATGDILVRGATWVRSLKNPANATLVGTFVTTDGQPDRLIKVEVVPPAASGITGGAIEVPASTSVRTGYLSPNFVNIFGVNALPSSFLPTTLTFERAGSVTANVLTVPQAGQYAEVIADPDEQRKLLEAIAPEQAKPSKADKVKQAVKKAKQKAAQ